MTLQPRQLPGCTVELVLMELHGKASKAAPWSGASRSDQVALLGHAQALIPAHRQPTSASVLDLSLKLTKGFAVRCVHLDLTSNGGLNEGPKSLSRVPWKFHCLLASVDRLCTVLRAVMRSGLLDCFRHNTVMPEYA